MVIRVIHVERFLVTVGVRSFTIPQAENYKMDVKHALNMLSTANFQDILDIEQ